LALVPLRKRRISQADLAAFAASASDDEWAIDSAAGGDLLDVVGGQVG
jgi:parvulin-like peptidyl-prolyl isomerase